MHSAPSALRKRAHITTCPVALSLDRWKNVFRKLLLKAKLEAQMII